jgi:hydrogenase/urease accessory protein HupE
MSTRRIDAAGLAVAAGLAFASYPQQAHAHLIETGLGPVYDGIIHFALTPEEMLPTFALAVFAGLRGKYHAQRVLFVLPLTWLVGGMLGTLANVAVPNSLSWLPLVALGGIVAADLPLSVAAATGIAAIFGFFLGFANAHGMAQAGLAFRAVIGTVGAVFVVTTLGAACSTVWQSGWLRIVWRVAGSWIAASGLLLLGWSLR